MDETKTTFTNNSEVTNTHTGSKWCLSFWEVLIANLILIILIANLVSIVLIDRLSIVLIDHSTIVHWVSQILCPPDPFWPLRVYSLFYFVIIGSFLFHGRPHRHHISPAIQLAVDVTILISSPFAHSSLNWYYMGKLKTVWELIGCWFNIVGITFCIIMFTIKVTVLLLWNLRPQTNVPLDQRQASANVKWAFWPAGDLGSYVFLRWPHPLFALLAKTKIPLTYWGDQGYTLTYRPNQGRNHAIGIIRKVFFLATII